MSCNHIMVDLETLGKKPGCVIASIGAVTFDPIAGEIGDSFYMRIDPQSCVRAGLQLDVDTVLWWMRQGDEARAEISGQGLQGILTSSLDALSYFMGARGVRYFWSHGSNFDGPILAAAYDAVGVKLPWEYWNARDTRTIFDLAGVKPDRADGVHHNALSDAEAQARAVIESYRKLGLGAPAGGDVTLTQPAEILDASPLRPSQSPYIWANNSLDLTAQSLFPGVPSGLAVAAVRALNAAETGFSVHEFGPIWRVMVAKRPNLDPKCQPVRDRDFRVLFLRNDDPDSIAQQSEQQMRGWLLGAVEQAVTP